MTDGEYIIELKTAVAALEAKLECAENVLTQVQRTATDLMVSTAAKNAESDTWRRSIDQWRWISIGAGFAGGGLAAMVARLFT